MIDPQQFSQLEQQNGLPAGLLAAVQQAESGGNANAISPAGALGAFQFIPSTAQKYGIDPLDPLQAANGAARMFGDLSKQFGGDVPSMLAAYNWGSGNLEKQGIANAPKETQDYISKVTGTMGKQYAQSDAIQSDAVTPEMAQAELDRRSAVSNQITPEMAQAELDRRNGAESKVGQIIQKRGAQGWDAINAYRADKQSLPETALQVFGKSGAGTVNDLVGAGIGSAFSALPDSVQQPVKSALNYVGQQVAPLVQGYDKLAQIFPRAARNVESAADIAGVLPIGAAADAARTPVGDVLQKVGEAVEDSGKASAAANKAKFVQDLVSPRETPTVAADQFSRSTEQGILKNRVVQPSPQEQSVIDTVSQLPVSKNKSLLANHNIIEDAKNNEAQSLINHLKNNDVPISDDSIIGALDNTYEQLKKNPYITGDGQKAANQVISGALEHLTNNQPTASGVLQARKDFDQWVTRLKSERAFDPATEGPVTTAIQQVRQTINGLVDQAVPDAGVKTSLAKQSNLYRAMDAIQTKGGYEGKNVITRAMQKATQVLPVKGAIAKTALATGLASTAAMAPALTGTALAAYGAKKAITSPALRKSIGYGLKTTGKILKK